MNVLFSFIARHKKVCLSDVTIFLQPPMHALVTRPYFSTPPHSQAPPMDTPNSIHKYYILQNLPRI